MQAWPAGAHGHQMLRREAERRVRGPVLQGVAARATAPTSREISAQLAPLAGADATAPCSWQSLTVHCV
jgi:hypothetical protein